MTHTITHTAEEYKQQRDDARSLLAQVVISSAQGALGDPAKRKSDIIIRVAEHLDAAHYHPAVTNVQLQSTSP